MDWIEPAGQEAPHSGQQAGGVGFYESVEMELCSNFLGSLRRQVVANVGFHRFSVFFVSPFGLNDLQIIITN